MAIAGMPSSAPSNAPGHRARVRHIVSEVPAFVDPGHDEIRKPAEDLRDREVHAVGRRAVDGEDIVGHRFEPERTPERQRVADGARFEHRRDDRDRTKRPERLGERDDALGSIAVVVGDENSSHVIDRL